EGVHGERCPLHSGCPPLHAVLRWPAPVAAVAVLDHADRVGGRPGGYALPGDAGAFLDPRLGEAAALAVQLVDAHVAGAFEPPGAAGVLVPDEDAHVKAVRERDLEPG